MRFALRSDRRCSCPSRQWRSPSSRSNRWRSSPAIAGKGDFPDGKRTDEHCFEWLYGGRALRDTHTVRAPGRPDYIGETTYYWDASAKRVEYLYIENLGGVSRGTMEPAGDALVFPPTQYVAPGEALTYRSRWSRTGDAAYEAFSGAQANDGWVPMFNLTMKRVTK
jgi:hypothetical protein